jgi:small subunit ribosomal protein S6
MNHYETVFILNPVLSEVQVKETVSKFEDFLTSRGAEMVSKDWGLKKWLTKFKTKKVVLPLFEFKVAEGSFETEFRRDERVMRFLTVSLDKHAISWAERRRTKLKSTKAIIMATLQQSASGKKRRYQISYAFKHRNKQTKKYCRFKKSGSNILIIKMLLIEICK